MSANVETMFYVREKPWHGLGKMVQEAPTSAEALKLAGLDWTVEARDMWLNGGYEPIPGYKANVRSSDNKVLGVVSNKYRIVQNAEAFAFTDALIGGDVHYETAGSLLDGKKIWLLAKLPDSEICGDKTETYMCFSNTHDGSGAVRVCMTPVRVVCNNTLNLALDTAQRAWSVRHVGDINTKLVEARLREILDGLFPEADDMTDRQKRHVQDMKDGYMVCMMAPDLVKFRNTAWGAVNAMSDFVTHSAPHRNTKNYQENNWNNVMNGHFLMDAMAKAVTR